MHDALWSSDASAPSLVSGGRLAIDRTECFELVEFPNEPEETRNIHFRVDDIDAASAYVMSQGLRMVRDLTAGAVRETIFHSDDLNGVECASCNTRGILHRRAAGRTGVTGDPSLFRLGTRGVVQ